MPGQDSEDDDPEPAGPAWRRRLATPLAVAVAAGSGVIAIVSPTVGAALGVVVTVLAALDELARPRSSGRTRR